LRIVRFEASAGLELLANACGRDEQLFIVVHADPLVEGVGGHGHPVLADYGA
jgi:hypothetical protein